MDDPDTRPEQYMPTESAEEHAEHDRDAFPAEEGTSHAPGGGARAGAAGGAGEGVPGGPVGGEPGESTAPGSIEPAATDRVAYDDDRDDFPDKRGAAGRSGVSPSGATPQPGEPRAAGQPGHEPAEPANTPIVHPSEERTED